MDYEKLASDLYGKSMMSGDPVPKPRQLEAAISDLWRSYPERPATFSACHNDACKSGQAGRGGYLCSSCIVGCVGAITGSPELAEEYHQAVLSCRRIKRELLQAAEPLRFNWKIKCMRPGGEDCTFYVASHNRPVTAQHALSSPSVKLWIGSDKLLSIEPGIPDEH